MTARSPIEAMIDQATGYNPATTPPSPPARTLAADDELAALLVKIADASKAWWEGMRPSGWSEEDHLANPCINCVGNREKSLARTISECVRNGW